MKTDANLIKKLNIKELLNNSERYIIPIYQRNYAWEAKEIEQLIQDVIDYAKKYSRPNYYIGTLVVSVEKDNGMIDFTTIDGQQRLTTLSILSAVIKNKYKDIDMTWLEKLNLRFASRKRSDASILAAYNGRFGGEDHEASIKAAYEICEQELVKRTKESGISVQEFADYLYQYVIILRVPLPEKIDLNHYFEIMNSRGEQLEKHEVLKATLMECFNGYEQKYRSDCEVCFDLIWEACSNMEKYVQYGFSTDQRHLIFGDNDWNALIVCNFDEFVGRIKGTLTIEDNIHASSIDDILNEKPVPIKLEESEESPDRFNSVVNFQNFLLHVLRVQLGKDEVALDDKRLLKLFNDEMPEPGPERIVFVKEFIYNLLKCKFLFDKYIIKREFTANTDRWSLKSLKCYSTGKVKSSVKYVNTYGEENSDSFDSDNRKVLMLLSMFHVSIPSMVYKYWLNAALNYLFHQFEVNSKEYISYLEHIAKAFVFDRYLSKDPKEYFDIVYKNLEPIDRNVEQLDLNKLCFGMIENNLVFNFMDYLLWTKYKDKEKDSRVKAFEYTFRSSVEHYYPQNPIKDDVARLASEYLHSFGNLCLISHEKNSRLSNFSANNKREFYGKKATIDSLKQFMMMKYSEWTTKEIEHHGVEMVNLLKENLSSSFQLYSEASLAAKWFKEYQVKNPVLLISALLCFGDFSKHVNGDKYNLCDFDYIRQHEAFQKFEAYVNEKAPKDLQEIIDWHLKYELLEDDYRYLFIKYPATISYCKSGNFLWFENTEGNLVYLLEEEARTKNKSREMYTYILQDYLSQRCNIDQYSDYGGLYIKIGYRDERYFIEPNEDEAVLELCIWNNDGEGILCHLKSQVNGNSLAIKQLGSYNWRKNNKGEYERLGKSMLVKLKGNYEENVSSLFDEVLKLFKNGFGIKL